jgi:cytosine/adenosine deaminase-related metal-dependent hydrolase
VLMNEGQKTKFFEGDGLQAVRWNFYISETMYLRKRGVSVSHRPDALYQGTTLVASWRFYISETMYLRKHGVSVSHRPGALYQGTTLVASWRFYISETMYLRKRGVSVSHRPDALYQGTALAVPHRRNYDWALAPARFRSAR